MELTDILDYLPLFGLYAETHYRFRYFPFSLYYRRMPEIIFDAPHRLEPDQSLPVFLIVKDGDRFPIELIGVTITLSVDGYSKTERIDLSAKLSTPIWFNTFEIDVSDLPSGMISVNASVRLRRRRKERIVTNDNHPGLWHAPLSVVKSADPLPNLSGWSSGELHCHTDFGADQVEFGAPLPIYRRAAQTLGLGWVALTDHSYNLDDLPGNYLVDDPSMRKWRDFQRTVADLNRNNPNVTLVPGEELTCRSGSGKNVHLLLLGNQRFLPGSGDSAQKWFHTRSELSVKEALSQIESGCFAAAAHPFTETGMLEKLLVSRGKWEPNDLTVSRLDGWQILTGDRGSDFDRGISEWVKALGRDERRYIYAGNDAHGNLNRFRQVRIPMIKLWEHHRHLFGKVMTSVMADHPLTVERIISSLKNGRATVSDGPALELTAVQDDRIYQTGSELPNRERGMLKIRYKSTRQYGKVTWIRILTGGQGDEIELVKFGADAHSLPHPLSGELTYPLNGERYCRAELLCRTEKDVDHRCFTNPIWLS